MQSDSDSESEFFDAVPDTQFDNSVEGRKQAQESASSKIRTKRHSSTSEDEKGKGGSKENKKKHDSQPSTPTDSMAPTPPSPKHIDNATKLGPALSKLELKDKAIDNEPKPPSTDSHVGSESRREDSKVTTKTPPAAQTDVESKAGQGVSDVAGSANQQEADTPPPVAPPRRKRKKKLAAASTEAVDKTDGPTKTCSEPPSPEATTSTPIKPLAPPIAAPEEDMITLPTDTLPPDNTNINDASDTTAAKLSNLLDNVEADDPSIQLDYRSQEMKEILAKASSTEVIPALTLDSRLKSHSVTSLTSGNRSDSFMSVASNASNGPTLHKSGSLASVGSLHSHHQSTLVRVRSASGRPLSEVEILEQVLIKDLDTGESIPLSLAEERLPKGTNPLALHIMRLTSEYHSNPDLATADHEDGGDVGRKVKKKTKKLKKFIGRTVNKMKVDKKIKEGKETKDLRSEESSSSDEEGTSQDTPSTPYIKVKSAHGKGPAEFEKLKLLQDLSGEHVGAVWTIKFSVCGRLMATAGQDHMVRVWVLKKSEEQFEEMRTKYSSKPTGSSSSHANSEEELVLSEQDEDEAKDDEQDKDDKATEGKSEDTDKTKEKKEEEDDLGPFKQTPFCTYCGHTGDVLDLSWSKNYFLLSSSMDKTVRLWHLSRTECLCCFQHIDFVTAIVFHPRDDRYFLSGSLDGKIRLWNIPDKKVALWNEVEGAGSNLITAANFCLQGRFAVIGTYDGRCIFYETERLKYHTQWQVRSSRNKRARGRKISGIEPMPGEEKVLITSNDSRIRLYDLKDNSLYCKYKGCSNTSSQIKASFSHDGQYLVCGSEDHFVYIWRTQHGIPSSRRDKNEFYESFSAHNVVVTAAIFAPVPWLVIEPDQSGNPVSSEVLVTADWGGAIKLFVNR